MIYDKEIYGNNVILRALTPEDCNQRYLTWLQDGIVNQFLETRWVEQDIQKIKEFVTYINESTHSWLFAIIHEAKHVGNIKIGPVHPRYKHADISYFIGEKYCWGEGIAGEAVSLILKFGFEILNLNRIEAGVFEQNIASQKVLMKNNFKREAILKKSAFLNIGDKYCDIYRYALLQDEYFKVNSHSLMYLLNNVEKNLCDKF